MDAFSELWPLEIASRWLNAIADRGHDLQACCGLPDLIGFFSPDTMPGLRMFEAFCYLLVISTYGFAFPLAHIMFPSKHQKKDLWCDRRALWGLLLVFWVEFCLIRAFGQWVETWKND